MLGALKQQRDIWKFQLRMALALHDAAPADRAKPAELDALVEHQLAYWRAHQPVAAEAAHEALRSLNQQSISTFVFSVNGRGVRLWPKAPPGGASVDAHRADEAQAFSKRARLYRAFIERALRSSPMPQPIEFAMDVNDFPQSRDDLPISGFQRHTGANNPLLPDVDFFYSKWYRREKDLLSYDAKSASAVFVGSSTGAWLDTESIRTHRTERLRAAHHFDGNPRVLFKIANAVHCVNEEARALLMSQPYFSSFISWEAQLAHRFVLSMDGNGAACSRLVKGLLSNSVVVKYASPHELYYFPALQAGQDYLLAHTDEDVERFVQAEVDQPGSYASVAQAGRRFAQRFLTIHSVMDYTQRLLAGYAALVRR
jgi:hypothetical protein